MADKADSQDAGATEASGAGVAAMTLDDVIAPLTRERFIADYWTKSHLVLKGAKGRFTPLLTWDDLNKILEQHRPSPSAIRLFQEGRPIDPKL